MYGVSLATATDARFLLGQPNGLAPLGADNLVPVAHLPPPTPPAFVPTRIRAGESFLVPENTQALYALPIVVDGTLIIDGTLVEVA